MCISTGIAHLVATHDDRVKIRKSKHIHPDKACISKKSLYVEKMRHYHSEKNIN